MECCFKTEVDAEFIERATGELSDCLLVQNLVYIERFYSGSFVVRLKSILRVAGLCLSLIGVLLCIAMAVLLPDACPAWLEVKIYLPLFIAGVAVFYYLPRLDPIIKRWTEFNAHKQCAQRARRSMSQVRKLVPLTVGYDIKGDLISCFRYRGDQCTRAWSGRLRGVALHGDRVTAIFKKAKSLQPRIIILHRDSQALIQALHNLSIEIKPVTGQ